MAASQVVTNERRVSRCLEDPDLFLVSDADDDDQVEIVSEPATNVIVEEKPTKKSVVLCLGAASTMGMVSRAFESQKHFPAKRLPGPGIEPGIFWH